MFDKKNKYITLFWLYTKTEIEIQIKPALIFLALVVNPRSNKKNIRIKKLIDQVCWASMKGHDLKLLIQFPREK